MINPVEFIGYQESDHMEPFPLFNVTDAKHERYGSTVSLGTVEQEELVLCYYPPFYKWKQEQTQKIGE